MSSTERLYYHDSHLTEFEARVISVGDHASGECAVVLDRTAFYPTGGGQPSDTGTLSGARVLECIDLEDGGVLHLTQGRAFQVGDPVRGTVDWARRLDHLQQHTGQHILSQALIKLFEAETRGFRMLEASSEIDVALENPTDERIEAAVTLANQIIWEDRPLVIRQVTKAEAAALPLRKESEREGSLRLIEIEGFDLTPCGGTHARRTGEVGLLAMRSWERAKGLTRIEFVAGGRALADYRRANQTARRVAGLFSVGRDEAVSSTARLLEEQKQLARRARLLEEEAAQAEARELYREAAANQPAGVKIIAKTFEGREAETLKRLALSLIAVPGTVALLGSSDGDASRLVFARSADAPGDMNALLREACAALEGRGGGRPDMAQGGGQHPERIAGVIEAAARSVRGA